MTISSTTVKNSYSGNGTLDTFNYTFKIFADSDLQVIIRDASATETVKTLTTHYTVTGAGSASGGTIVFTAGNIPSATETVVIRRAVPQTQAIDYIANDPFPAESHEEGLDRAMMAVQQLQEEVDRSIKLSRTNTMNSTEFAVGSTTRAGKIFGFDSNGELVVSQELGTFKGNWSSATTFSARDIVKDTSNNNIYLCNTGHTSSGTQPISTNTDVAKWDLLVDAASATSSATAAASSATAAATSATNAATSATASATSATASANSATTASTQATNAANSATAAQAAQTAAELAADNFDDTYLGAKASDPTVDNDGDALTTGDLYFNTTSNTLKVYNGTTWQDAALTAANFLTVANNLSDLSSASTARTNLGLGTAAVESVATLQDIVNDTTPQLGGDLDVNGNEFVSTSNGDIVFSPNGTGKIKFNDLAYYPEASITSTSNAVAWDSQAQPNAKHTTTENTTFSAPSNATTGSFISLNIQYGGSHTIAFNTVFEFAGSTAPTFTSVSGQSDHLVFRYNGTVWQEMGRTLNMSAT